MGTSIAIDLKSPGSRFNRFFLETIGSENLGLALRTDYLAHLALVQSEIGFRRLRSHGFFVDLIGVYREISGEAVYNFQTMDQITDEWLRLGIRPFVEFGMMPKDLASGSQTIFWYRANVTPPRNQERWGELVERTLRHWVQRYGIEEVAAWRFEVWNEPDLQDFWSGTQADYFQLYATTSRAVKRVDPRLKVGGPATSRNLWIAEFLDFCSRENVPVDFVSTHHYCVDSALDLDGNSTTAYRGQPSLRADVEAVRRKIQASDFADVELHYTEWNVTPLSRDPVGHDSEFTAAFVLQTLTDVAGQVDSYSYWAFTDIEEHVGPRHQPFDGSFGLVSTHGLRKPVFHAYRWLASMYDEEIKVQAPSTRVTRHWNGDLRILCWNHVEPAKVDFRGGEWTVPEAAREDVLVLSPLHGDFVVKSWLVDRNHGNAFRAWQKLGAPTSLSRDQLSALQEASKPRLLRHALVSCSAELLLPQRLESCGVVYHEITKA